MRKRKKKRITRFLFLVVCITAIFLYFGKDEEKDVDDNTDTTSNKYIEVVDYKESDQDIIEKVFADGMSISNFNNVINKQEKSIKKTHDYAKIEYNFEKKLHYSEIEEILYELNSSDIVKLENIGSSVDSRKIYSIEIGKGTKEILIDNNIHAAESGNTLILLKYMISIVNKYEDGDSKIKSLLNNAKLVVLPCINPDGYEIYNFGIDSLNDKNLWIYDNKEDVDFDNFKYNANGIDINRNMPTQNAGLYYKEYDLINSVSLSKTTSNGTYYGGTELGSEPETQALMYFMLKHYKNTVAYINMHSQGRVIYQGKPNLSNKFNNLCLEFANLVSSYTDYTVHGLSSEEVGEGNDGSATDFMAELANGFLFSKSSGRLASKEFNGENTKLKYNYPVITMETLDRYTRDPQYYKDEYVYRDFYDMFTRIITKYVE